MTSLPKNYLIYYAFIATPLAFVGLPLYIYAPDFYATEFSISLATLGTTLLILRFIDAIQDPIIGRISDKYSKFRLFIIILSSLILALCFFLLFVPFYPNLPWFAMSIFFATTAFSIIIINVNTLGALWGSDKQSKTVIVSYREFFGIFGLIVAVVLPGVLQQFISKQYSFIVLSLIMVMLIIVANVLFGIWLKKYQYVNISNISIADANYDKTIVTKAKLFFVVYFISMLASSVPAVLVIFFIRDFLLLEQYTGLFLMIYFISGALGILLWKNVSIIVGKYKTWLYAMVVAVLSFIWAYALEPNSFIAYTIICLLSGIAFGAELVMPPSILADIIKESKLNNQASYYFSILAFLTKFSLAIASAFGLWYLDLFNFQPGILNTTKALNALSIIYALIPTLIKCAAIYFLWKFIYENNIINRSDDSYGKL